MRAVVYVNENRFWIDILKCLETQGVQTTYIFGSPRPLNSFQNETQIAFPNARYHDHYAAVRGEFDEPDLVNHSLKFDAAARRLWEDDGHGIIELMQRMDSRDDFSYRSRRDLFYLYLKFSDFILTRYEINCQIASLIPHDPFLRTLHLLMRNRGFPTATFTYSNYDGRRIPFGDGDLSSRAKLLQEYKSLLRQGRATANLSPLIRAEFERRRGNGNVAAAKDYLTVNEWVKKFSHHSIKDAVLHWVGILAADLRDVVGVGAPVLKPMPTRFEKEPRREPSESFIGPFARLRHEVWFKGNQRLLLTLKRAYRRICSTTPLAEPYVFVPLHAQPELSSTPLGGAFAFQILMLETLSAALPNDWHIVVKEHPSQFNPWLNFPCQGRRVRDYELMARIPKLTFVPTEVDQFELIDGAKAIATITGTAGWEALLRGKPTLIFGNAWYLGCQGVHAVRDLESCQEAFRQIQSGAVPTKLSCELFAEAIDRTCAIPFAGHDGDWQPWVIDGLKPEQRDEGVRGYANLLLEMLQVYP